MCPETLLVIVVVGWGASIFAAIGPCRECLDGRTRARWQLLLILFGWSGVQVLILAGLLLRKLVSDVLLPAIHEAELGELVPRSRAKASRGDVSIAPHSGGELSNEK